MDSEYNRGEERGAEFDYLCVDAFAADILTARALQTAFEIGLIDFILQTGPVSSQAVLDRLRIDQKGLDLLVDLLIAGRVISDSGSVLKFSDRFLEALRFRELLQMKLVTSILGAKDLLDHFTDMIAGPAESLPRMRFRGLFAYDRAIQQTPENIEWTKRWTAITTRYTRYESAVCMKHYDFGRHRRMLDVGGNSGEFALRICKGHSKIEAVILDLPLVCRIGEEHVSREPEAGRIRFLPGNAVDNDLPGGFDLITYKSMLHDWPDRIARGLIRKGASALDPGGTLLIFERGAIETAGSPPSFSGIPMVLFYRSFRSPIFYQEELDSLGFVDVSVEKIDLEFPFYLVKGRKV